MFIYKIIAEGFKRVKTHGNVALAVIFLGCDYHCCKMVFSF